MAVFYQPSRRDGFDLDSTRTRGSSDQKQIHLSPYLVERLMNLEKEIKWAQKLLGLKVNEESGIINWEK